MTPLEWLKCILQKPEDEVLALLNKHPELADLPIKIECSVSDDGSPCKCFEKYELISSVDMTTETFWSDYICAVSEGACHHVAKGNQRFSNSSDNFHRHDSHEELQMDQNGSNFHRHDSHEELQMDQNGSCAFSKTASSMECLIDKTTSLTISASIEPPMDQDISQRNSLETIELPLNQDIQKNTKALEIQKNKDIGEEISEELSVQQNISLRNFATTEPPLNQDISERCSKTQEPLDVQGGSDKSQEITEPPDDQVISQRNSETLSLPIIQSISDGNFPRTLENKVLGEDQCQNESEMSEQPLNIDTTDKNMDPSCNNVITESANGLILNENGLQHNLENDLVNDLEDDLEESSMSFQPESHTAAVYVVHIAVVLNKQKILQKILPSTLELEKNPKLWRNLITWHNMASPLHLSIVSKNKDIFSYILQHCTHLLHHRGLQHNTVLGTASANNDVDFLQLAFASCDKTEMIGHLELPYMYDLGNCLSCAVERRALDSLRLLIAKGASKYLAFDKYLALTEKLIEADDIETFTIFIDDPEAQNMSDVLIQIIEHGRSRLAAVLLATVARLESTKGPPPVSKSLNMLKDKMKRSTGYLNERIPYLIYSLIINAEDVARVLIADDKNLLSKYGQYKQYSAIDWTMMLRKNDLELCIKQRYGDTVAATNEALRKESPIVAALKLNFRPMNCVRKLIEQGFNLNDVTSENETPFSISVTQHLIGRTPGVRNQLIRFLLKNGADPFRGRMAMEAFPCRGNNPFSTVIMKHYLNYRIIPEILYAGADISGSTLVNALVQNYKNATASNMLVLILKTGCKATNQQRDLLAELQVKPDIDEELAEQINIYLNEFPDLFSLCRNSVRSFCGTNLQYFITNSELPNKIKNSLLFKDIFEQYIIVD